MVLRQMRYPFYGVFASHVLEIFQGIKNRLSVVTRRETVLPQRAHCQLISISQMFTYVHRARLILFLFFQMGNLMHRN